MARAGNGTSGAKNSAGFSPDALKAAIAGGVTQSTAPTAENSLGYAIEASDVGYLSTSVQLAPLFVQGSLPLTEANPAASPSGRRPRTISSSWIRDREGPSVLPHPYQRAC